MNVIFLDFDGVIDTIHNNSYDDIENKIKILSDICKEYNCKVVISAAAKGAIDEETMKSESKWINYIFNLFKKYSIQCIGRTPNVKKIYSPSLYFEMWKDYEIILYLFRHPEIEHYCVLDDDDLAPNNSDLNKVRAHLLNTIYYSDNPKEEGLLEVHKDEIGNILQKENEIRKFALKRKDKIN